MIKFIAALDSKKGMANEHGIPWDLPTDKAYFRTKTDGGTMLMGYGTYVEFSEALPNRRNLVASSKNEPLRTGFEPVKDAESFLKNTKENVWVIGGPGLFSSTIALADELYLTRIDTDFGCTKFFPSFEQDFRLTEQSESQTENGVNFRFEVWTRK